MNRILNLLPEIDGEEMVFIQQLTNDLNDEDAKTFANIYRAKRRDNQNMLVFSLLGLVAIPGAQRFYINQVGMGILYFFTAGLCFIGSIIDLVNYKKLALEYNQKMAREALAMMGPGYQDATVI